MNSTIPNRLLPSTGIPSGKWTAAWTAGLVVAFAILLPLDSWIATWLDIDKLPGDLVKAVNLMELFGHGTGAVLIIVGVVSLMPERWRDAMRLLVGWGLAGLVVNLVKMLVFRYRPAYFYPGLSGEEQSWIGTSLSGVGHEGHVLNSRYLTDSFPSGHSAQVVVMAVMLSIMFPRGRYFFGVLAVLACLQRVMGHAHWASDTVAGAAIGCVCGYLAFRFPLPAIFYRNRTLES